MKEKERKISKLESQITLYSIFGWLFVALALIPIGEVTNDVFIQQKPWPEVDLGTFLGGVSGTFAALAGVFFVFVAFLGQRISIIQQQIEIQNNIQELRDTREEIRGQKEQLELQNKQFQIQSFENVFFNLIQGLLNKKLETYKKIEKSKTLSETVNVFKNYVINTYPLENWGSMTIDEKVNFYEDAYFKVLDTHFGNIQQILDLTNSILSHIESNNSIIDKNYYQQILYANTDQIGRLILFYSYFQEEFWLYEKDYATFKHFLNFFHRRDLIMSSDLTLLNWNRTT